MVLNARSIFNKVDELKAHIEIYKPDIIFITETWLSENIPNEAIHIDDFNVDDFNDSLEIGGNMKSAWRKKGITTTTYPEILIKTTQSGGRRSINLGER
jgi:hypothetical protein